VPAINKGRHSQLLNDFSIFSTINKSIFNTLDVVFGEIFLLPSINSTQFCLKCVINFAHNRIIGLVIKSEHYFQWYNKFRVVQNRVAKASVAAPLSPYTHTHTHTGPTIVTALNSIFY